MHNKRQTATLGAVCHERADTLLNHSLFGRSSAELQVCGEAGGWGGGDKWSLHVNTSPVKNTKIDEHLGIQGKKKRRDTYCRRGGLRRSPDHCVASSQNATGLLGYGFGVGVLTLAGHLTAPKLPCQREGKREKRSQCVHECVQSTRI